MNKIKHIGKCNLIISCFFVSFLSFAGDPMEGKKLSVSCTACHGPAGISIVPLWPNLAGQKEEYLIKQLKAFRSGERKNPPMLPFVAPLSDEDMEDLAAYYSSLKCE